MSKPPSQPSQRRRWRVGEVRALRARLAAAARDATELLEAPQRLRFEAAQLLAELARRRAVERLAESPVSDLRPGLAAGTRLKPIEQAGFASIGALLGTTPQRLAAIEGIGTGTAFAVWEAADRVRGELVADLGFRFDPDRRDPDEAVLLGLVAAIRTADAGVWELGPGPGELIETAAMLLPHTEPVASGVRRLLAGKRARVEAFVAVAELERQLDASTELLNRLELRLPTIRYRRPVEPVELWRRFGLDAASVYTVLSRLGPVATADEAAAARGHLDDESVREIGEITLDTRLLRSALRGYQHFGAQFALRRRRAILGDEMGLGKTVQALAVSAHLAAAGGDRTLVVCPASVLLNWLVEIDKHTTLPGYRLHGDERDRERLGRHWLDTGGVAVTTFDTLPRLRFLADEPFALLIVDEAHQVKNPETQRARAMQPLIDRVDHTLLLTGTPLENKVEDFRNLVARLRPALADRLGPGDHMVEPASFRRKVAEVYLRRNQSDVLRELPERIDVDEWVLLTRADAEVYRAALGDRPVPGTLERLRHAAYRSADSAKLRRVAELVHEAVAEGMKVVVFSRYLDVLDRVAAIVGDARVWTLTGAVPAPRRQLLIDEFTIHEGPAVLLAQIDIGGTGVNLQTASTVIITEPQWKPGTEDQAVARLHRMGQVRTVQVHRILARETVDELLLVAQDRKRELFDEFARESHAKDADARAVDTSMLPAIMDDDSIPLEQRIVMTEFQRSSGGLPTGSDIAATIRLRRVASGHHFTYG